jgi:hypothetical protein
LFGAQSLFRWEVLIKLCSALAVSLYFKQKLRTQYVNALDDAKKELVLIEQALDKITEVKQEIGEKQGECREWSASPPSSSLPSYSLPSPPPPSLPLTPFLEFWGSWDVYTICNS